MSTRILKVSDISNIIYCSIDQYNIESVQNELFDYTLYIIKFDSDIYNIYYGHKMLNDFIPTFELPLSSNYLNNKLYLKLSLIDNKIIVDNVYLKLKYTDNSGDVVKLIPLVSDKYFIKDITDNRGIIQITWSDNTITDHLEFTNSSISSDSLDLIINYLSTVFNKQVWMPINKNGGE